MRGATSVDDSALEQELMCWLAETGSQEGSSWRISRYLNHRGRGKSPDHQTISLLQVLRCDVGCRLTLHGSIFTWRERG